MRGPLTCDRNPVFQLGARRDARRRERLQALLRQRRPAAALSVHRTEQTLLRPASVGRTAPTPLERSSLPQENRQHELRE